MKKEKRQLAEISQRYACGLPLGEGGNAIVLEATCLNGGGKVALKRLRFWTQEKESRFKDEIRVMKGEASAIDGVMPIIDSSGENCWYTMPIAIKVMDSEIVKKGDVVGIVDAFIPLLQTLHNLHKKGICHRDIKPGNIYLLNGRLTFGDFGLVDYPDGADLTQSDRPLGAIFTRAPEMLRNPKTADGKSADVYSMAKTLWMLLSKDEKGFDGQYNERDEAHRLNKFKHLKDEHLLEIEKLIERSTCSKPEERPSTSEFIDALEEWRVIHEDEDISQAKDWKHLSELLFNDLTPESAAYSGAQSVVKVLTEITHCQAYNHMFVPKGGGLDLDYVTSSAEDGCIKILGNGCWLIVKPRKLFFRGFRDIRWNYFLLETEDLQAVLSPEHNDGWYEGVVEDTPGHYVDDKDACYGVYDYDSGVPFPTGWISAERVLRGKFLFVMKRGHYNQISATYDARHCDCTEQQFYELICGYERLYDDGERRGFSQEQILSHHQFSANPFTHDEMELPDMSLPSPKEFIDKNFSEWRFELPVVDKKEGILSFYFVFDITGYDFHSLFEDPKEWVLTKTGRIVEKKKGVLDDDVFYVSERDTAFRVEEMLNAQILKYCEGYDTDYNMVYFKIAWKRNGKPIHLFTKEELERLYKDADDRRGNKLVIDEFGYAHLVSPDTEGTAFPVCHETFQARRNNVGKYSRLLTLEADYMESLEAWLCYLQHGIYVYCDGSVYPSAKEDELRAEIKKFY